MPPRTRRRYEWDDAAGRYRGAGGRFVPRAEVRREIERGIAATRTRATRLAAQLQSRAITLDAWVAGMRDVVRDTHWGNLAAAKGGWAQLTPADYGRAGRAIRDQFGYLEGFADQIERGLPLDGRFLRRAAMYADAGRATYTRAERAEMTARGFDEERNIRYAGDSCDGCIAATARGWVPLGELPLIGTRDCLTGCRCELVYRSTATGAVTG